MFEGITVCDASDGALYNDICALWPPVTGLVTWLIPSVRVDDSTITMLCPHDRVSPFEDVLSYHSL